MTKIIALAALFCGLTPDGFSEYSAVEKHWSLYMKTSDLEEEYAKVAREVLRELEVGNMKTANQLHQRIASKKREVDTAWAKLLQAGKKDGFTRNDFGVNLRPREMSAIYLLTKIISDFENYKKETESKIKQMLQFNCDQLAQCKGHVYSGKRKGALKPYKKIFYKDSAPQDQNKGSSLPQ